MNLALKITTLAAAATLAGAVGTASAQSAQNMNDGSADQATSNQMSQQDSTATMKDHTSFRQKLKAWTAPRSSPAKIEQESGEMAAPNDHQSMSSGSANVNGDSNSSESVSLPNR